MLRVREGLAGGLLIALLLTVLVWGSVHHSRLLREADSRSIEDRQIQARLDRMAQREADLLAWLITTRERLHEQGCESAPMPPSWKRLIEEQEEN